MFEGLKYRWDNRGKVCMKCKKKLVAGEKIFCKKCATDIRNGTGGAVLGLGLTALGIKHHNNKK